MIGEVRKGLLLTRASYECEYCKRLLSEIEYQIEHIWPKSRGGKTTENNLAISCQRCNKNKSYHTEWIDPISGSTFPLFNPRKMDWHHHFKRTHNEINGITEIGRATAALLFRNTSQYLPPDLAWSRIEGLYRNQALYYFLNHLRYRRIRNDFNGLYKQLISPLPPVEASPEEQKIAYFAKDLLLLELFFTRSSVADVTKGIAYGTKIIESSPLTQEELGEVLNFLSILFQQRATIHFAKGNMKLAQSDQDAAYRYYLSCRGCEKIELSKNANPDELAKYLRTHTVRWKYEEVDFGIDSLASCFERIKDLDQFYATSHYSYLVDLVLLNQNVKNNILENLYDTITSILKFEGYGTNTDYAKLITLRRRWWALHFLLENNLNYNSLISDIKLWNKLSMFNEIRELDGYIKRIGIRKKTQIDIAEILKTT